MSRRSTLVVGLVALQALALIVVLGLTYWASQSVLLGFAESHAARIARDATAYTEDFLEPAGEAAELTRRLAEAQVVRTNDRTRMTRYFFELLKAHPPLDGIFFGAVDGAFLYVSRNDGVPGADFRLKQISVMPRRSVRLTWFSAQFRRLDAVLDPEDMYDPRERPWYSAARSSLELAWTEPYIFFSSQKPGITVAAQVRDPSGGDAAEGAGVVGVDIGLAELSEFLELLDISRRGSAAIVAESGNIIAHSKAALVAPPSGTQNAQFNTITDGVDPVLMQAAASVEGGLEDLLPGEIRLSRFTNGGETWIGAVQRLRLPGTPWTVVTFLPEADILEPLTRLRNTAIAVVMAVLAATGILGLVFVRAVTRDP